MNRKLLSLALLCMVASVDAAQAQVYKWTDAAGVVHYSDAPPPQDTPKVETMHVSGGDHSHPTAAESSATAEAGDAPKTAATANTPAAPNAPLPDTPDNRVQLCERARQNLELLQSKYPVGLDAAGNGKPQVLDDAARKIQVEKAQQNIA